MHLVIIGGGITGLSAAWEAQRHGLSYTLLEASDRWGGKIISSEIQLKDADFIVEGGPDTIATRKPEAWNLARELGISDQVEDPGSERRGLYVLDCGSLHAIPLSPFEFIGSRLLTGRGKLRMLAEPFQPARRDECDESLGDFIRRRLGPEALDKYIGPVLGGIYNSDPDLESILVSSPVLRDMERESGSLFLAALKHGLKSATEPKQDRKPRFITFRMGMQFLVDELVRQLCGDLRLSTHVIFIERRGRGYSVWTSNGKIIHADELLLATPAHVAADLVRGISRDASRRLRRIQHHHIGIVSLVYREADVPNTEVARLMIPRSEGRAIDAVAFPSRRRPGGDTSGYEILRVFIGGGRPETVEYPLDRLMAAVQTELCSLLNVQAQPVAYRIFRWPNGVPQANVDHLCLVNEIEGHLPGNISLAGSSYRGFAIPDCIRQGREAVQKICRQRRNKEVIVKALERISAI